MTRRFLKVTVLLAGIGLAVFTPRRRRPSGRLPHIQQSELPSEPTRVLPVEKTSVQSQRANAKRWMLRFTGMFVVLGLGGFILAASGIVSIKASSGHWAITRWFLQFSKSRSLAIHTLGLRIPSLDEPWKIMKGAGHYDIGCAPCHGNPFQAQSQIAEQMLPPPPPLRYIRSRRDDAELFYIVKHGIKFTGMPAWPSEYRDDEVWSIVAFLRQWPALDAQRYRELASGRMTFGQDAASNLQHPQGIPRPVVESCARCHGVDGLGRDTGAFPKLARQTPKYLVASLQAYARRERHSGIMGPIAARLTQDEIEELARYYANLPPQRSVSATSSNTEAIARGREIALQGIPQRRVPACIECHGPRAGPRNPIYPDLTGQYSEYLLLQLELFSQQRRGGTPYAHLMHFVAGHLTPEQMRDVAVFFESLADQDETVTIR